ncbi:hypothetical protein [Amycolatopsis sp. RTGN1]|uniref:hypothetical protein n=1 Tax=Amycolatopsis ponsaeliensis TaxID=2992142 RepID=UPI00254D362D|nr:hypothetical protein [Amycolatopsis sp. RTGN1]
MTTVDRPDATYIPRCRDVVLWVCGTEKLDDLGAGWLGIVPDARGEIPDDGGGLLSPPRRRTG